MKKHIKKSVEASVQSDTRSKIKRKQHNKWHLPQDLQWKEVLLGSIISVIAITASVYLGANYPLKHKTKGKSKTFTHTTHFTK
jgi:hypothetical protein